MEREANSVNSINASLYPNEAALIERTRKKQSENHIQHSVNLF